MRKEENLSKSTFAMRTTFFAMMSLVLLGYGSGCVTVNKAREAKKAESMVAGERVVSFEETGISTEAPVEISVLEDAALKANPVVLQAKQGVVLSQLALKNIKSSYIPTVDGSIGYTLIGSDSKTPDNSWVTDDVFNAGLTLNWLVYDFGKTKALTRKAISDLKAAELSYKSVENRVKYNVRSACYLLQRMISLDEVAKEALVSYDEHLRQMRDRYEVGAVNSYAVTKASVDRNNAVLQTIVASNNVCNARVRLGSSLGVINAPSFDVKIGEVKEYTDMSVEELMEKAKISAPMLASLRASAEGAAYYVDKTISDLYPSLGVNVSYTVQGNGSPYLQDLMGVGALSQSIFSAGRNKRAIESAVAQLRIARSKVAEEELSLYNNLTTAKLDALKAKQQLDVAKETEKMAQENFDIVTERYNVGKASELERTDAQVNLSNAKAAAVSALFDYYDSQIYIALLIGE